LPTIRPGPVASTIVALLALPVDVKCRIYRRLAN
jgi:hypothetical protein